MHADTSRSYRYDCLSSAILALIDAMYMSDSAVASDGSNSLCSTTVDPHGHIIRMLAIMSSRLHSVHVPLI